MDNAYVSTTISWTVKESARNAINQLYIHHVKELWIKTCEKKISMRVNFGLGVKRLKDNDDLYNFYTFDREIYVIKQYLRVLISKSTFRICVW